jgi:hypothetical protein
MGGGIDRSQFLAEIQKNPELFERAAHMVKGEVGLGPNVPIEKQLIQLESSFNRPQIRGHSYEQSLWSRAEHGEAGYYASDTYRASAKPTPQELEHFREKVWKPVLAGSDVGTKFLGKLVTGNASGRFAQDRLDTGVYGAGKWFGEGPNREMYVQEKEKGEAAKRLEKGLPRLPDADQKPALETAKVKPSEPTAVPGMFDKTLTPTEKPSSTSPSAENKLTITNKGQGADPRLVNILTETSKYLPEGWRAELRSGYREGDPRFHGQHKAADVQLIDPKGREVPWYQSPDSFRTYEAFAHKAREVQQEKYPSLSKDFAWGGYFGGTIDPSGRGRGTYGAMDLMHFDLGGTRGTEGTFEKGLSAEAARRWGVMAPSQLEMTGPVQTPPTPISSLPVKLGDGVDPSLMYPSGKIPTQSAAAAPVEKSPSFWATARHQRAIRDKSPLSRSPDDGGEGLDVAAGKGPGARHRPEEPDAQEAQRLRDDSEVNQSPEPYERGRGREKVPTEDLDVASGKGRGARGGGGGETVDFEDSNAPSDSPKDLEKASGGGSGGGGKSTQRELEDAVGGGEE